MIQIEKSSYLCFIKTNYHYLPTLKNINILYNDFQNA